MTLGPLSQASVFIYSHVGSGPYPSHGVFLPLPLLQALQLLVAEQVPLLLPSPTSLFIYSSMRDCPSLPLWLQGALPSLLRDFFCCCCLLYSFIFLFTLDWGSVCPEGYADLAQGCLWEYRVPLSSPGGLHLPKLSGSW
jgi:hypothetical protein